MNRRIIHSGIVEQITGSHVTVRIEQRSACASCKAAALCSVSERKEKLVEIDDRQAISYEVGDHVSVSTDLGTGYRAVAVAFVIPLVLMLATIAVVRALTGNDGQAALMGLAALIPCYLAIYAMRGRLQRQFSFRIDHRLDT